MTLAKLLTLTTRPLQFSENVAIHTAVVAILKTPC